MLLILLLMGFVPNLYAAKVFNVLDEVPSNLPRGARTTVKTTLYAKNHMVQCYEIGDGVRSALEIRASDLNGMVIVYNPKKEALAVLFVGSCDDTIGNEIRAQGNDVDIHLSGGLWSYVRNTKRTTGTAGQPELPDTVWTKTKGGS
ncbi:uncharacterized protein LOC128995367 [Macrosteles quadrilineatus]|uniref:uncharacterized protein LOC128995367 n=1 Tax=Macrosteles quadrilineatus TaxID=74068 RepID=UPI0023E1ECF1|nr:uncharacterized protein LOC128995367 [Macrosteles quadrilineatus]